MTSTPKPIPPASVAYLVRHLLEERHLLIHTKPFAQILVALGPHMDGIEQEWAATQPTMKLADEYISDQLERLSKAQTAFRVEKAQHEKQRKAVAKEIVRLAASL